MARVLVSDTSILIDLDRGGILDDALRLPFEFAVPDLLFERELRAWNSPVLGKRLSVLSLEPSAVELAVAFRRQESKLSLPDAFALALAKVGGHTLLAGDGALRALADVEGVDCHGVLWLMDEMEIAAIVSSERLYQALTAVSQHPRCRLPKLEIRKRLDRWTV